MAVQATTANFANSAGWTENPDTPIQRRDPFISRTMGLANGSSKINSNSDTTPSTGHARRCHMWYSTRDPINMAAPPMVAPISWRSAKVDPGLPAWTATMLEAPYTAAIPNTTRTRATRNNKRVSQVARCGDRCRTIRDP